MEKFNEFIKSFFNHLRALLDLGSKMDEKEFNSLLVQQGRNEEEKNTIIEILEEIDLEHKLKDELVASGLEPGEWLEQELEKTTKELYPDATPEDIDMVKKEVARGMEEEIALEAECLEEETTGIPAENNEKDK